MRRERLIRSVSIVEALQLLDVDNTDETRLGRRTGSIRYALRFVVWRGML